MLITALALVYAQLPSRFFTTVAPVQPIGVRQPIPLPFQKSRVFSRVTLNTPSSQACLDETDPSGLSLASQVDPFSPLTLMAQAGECGSVIENNVAVHYYAPLRYNTDVAPVASELVFGTGSLHVTEAAWSFTGCPALDGCPTSNDAHTFTMTVGANTRPSADLVFGNGTTITLPADALRPGYIYAVTASLTTTVASEGQDSSYNGQTLNITTGRTSWLFTHGPPVGGIVTVSPPQGAAVTQYFDVATTGWKALVDVMAAKVTATPSRKALLVHYQTTFLLPKVVLETLASVSASAAVLGGSTAADVAAMCDPLRTPGSDTYVQPYVAGLLIHAAVTGLNASAFCSDIIVISKALMSSTAFNTTSATLNLEVKKLYPLRPLSLQFAFRVDDHALPPPLPVVAANGTLDTTATASEAAADVLAHIRSQELWPGSPLTSLTGDTTAYLPLPLPGTTAGSINMTAGVVSVYVMAVDSEANVGFAVFNVSLTPPLGNSDARNVSSVSSFITAARDALYADFVQGNAAKPLPPLSVLTMCQTLGNILQSASSSKALETGEGISAEVAEANALSRHHLALFVKTAMDSLAAAAGSPTPTPTVTGWRANLGVSKPDSNAMVGAAALDAGALQAAAGSLSSFVNDPFELAKNSAYQHDMEQWSSDALVKMMKLSLPRESNVTTAAAVSGAAALEPVDDANLQLSMSVISGLMLGRTMPAPTVGPDGKMTLTVTTAGGDAGGSGGGSSSGGGHSHNLRRQLQASRSRTASPTASATASRSSSPTASATASRSLSTSRTPSGSPTNTPRRSPSPMPVQPPMAQPMPPAAAAMMAANLQALGAAAMRAAAPGDAPVSLTGGMPPAVAGAINSAAAAALNAALASMPGGMVPPGVSIPPGALPPGVTMPPGGLPPGMSAPAQSRLPPGVSAPPFQAASAQPGGGASGNGGPSNAAAPPSLGPMASVPVTQPSIPPLASINPACMPPEALAMLNFQAQRVAVPLPAGMSPGRRLSGTHPESALAGWAATLNELAEDARLHPRRLGRHHSVLKSYRAPARRLQAAAPPAGCPTVATPVGAGAGLPSMFTPLLAAAASVSAPPAVLQGLAAAGLVPPGSPIDIQTTTFVVPPHNMTAEWSNMLPPELAGMNLTKALAGLGAPGTPLTAAQALAAMAAAPPLQNVIPLPNPMASGTTSINMMTPRGEEIPVTNTVGGGIVFTMPLASGFPMSDGLPPPVSGPDTVMVQCPTQAQVTSGAVRVGSLVGSATVASITTVRVNQTLNAVVPPTAAKLPLQAFAPGNAPIPPPTMLPGQVPMTVQEVPSSIIELRVACGDRGSAVAICAEGLLGQPVPVACPMPKSAPLPSCGYWDPDSNEWDTDGCTMVSFTATTITCNCTHLTDFVARFDALAESQVQVFTSALELDDPAAYERAFYVFITIALVGAAWLASGLVGRKLDRGGKMRFYRFLRADKEIQSLVALEAARGGKFLVDREFDSDASVQAEVAAAEAKEAAAAAASGAKKHRGALQTMYDRSRAFAESRVVIVEEEHVAKDGEGSGERKGSPLPALPSAIPEGNEAEEDPQAEAGQASPRPRLDVDAPAAPAAAGAPAALASPAPHRSGFLSTIPVFAHMWYMRLWYSHSFLGILTRYDPQNLRWARFSLFFTMLVSNLFFTAFFYGYTYGTPTSSLPGELSYGEALVLSLISSAIAFPIELVLNWAYARAAEMSFKYRHIGIFSELYRRRVVGKKLAKLTNEELTRIAYPESAAASPYGAVQATSAGSDSMRSGSLRFFRSSRILPAAAASSSELAAVAQGSEEAAEGAEEQPAKPAKAAKARASLSLKDFEKKKQYDLKHSEVVASLLVGVSITAAWCAFCLFYVILFGVWQPMDVSSQFLTSWVQAIFIGALVMEPLFMGLGSAWMVFIQPRLTPCISRTPCIRKLPAFADETASSPSLRSVLTSRLENVTLVSAAGFASQLGADQAVFVFGATSVVSALLRGVVSGVASAFRPRAGSSGLDASAQHRAALLQRAYVRLRMDAAAATH